MYGEGFIQKSKVYYQCKKGHFVYWNKLASYSYFSFDTKHVDEFPKEGKQLYISMINLDNYCQKPLLLQEWFVSTS